MKSKLLAILVLCVMAGGSYGAEGDVRLPAENSSGEIEARTINFAPGVTEVGSMAGQSANQILLDFGEDFIIIGGLDALFHYDESDSEISIGPLDIKLSGPMACAGAAYVNGNSILNAAASDARYQSANANLGAMGGLSSSGFVARTGAGTAAARSITGTEISVTNGDGVSGNPTLAIASGAVTAAKLADAVADQVLGAPAVTVANSGSPDGNATITLQAKDGQGNNLAARCVLRVWLDDGAYGAPTDLGELAATTGVILSEEATDAVATVVTDASGTAVLTLDTASNGTVHAMAVVVGLAGTGNASITGN